MPAFQWLSWQQANQEISVRLGDPNQIFWTQAEIYLYLTEALQVYNCLTSFWKVDYAVTLTPPFTGNWLSTNVANSPRLQSTTDTSIYTLIEYHLLEPPTGGTWTGTNQFTMADLAQAVSRRRNEILQISACNMTESTIGVTPNQPAFQLPDTTLDTRRVRWVPAANQGSPVTLQRADSRSFQAFSANFRQTYANPLRWDVLGSPPQTVTLDTNVNVPSSVQVLGVTGAADFNPPTASPTLIPNDWNWVLKFGALADLLSMEQEGKDLERAKYCRQRYEQGLKAMVHAPWLMQAFIDNVPVDTPSVEGSDRFNYEWQSNANAFPGVVVGGIDLFAISSVPQVTSPVTNVGVTLKLVGNAPIPVLTTDPVQVTRDAMNAIISEAQHLALFKNGGTEAAQSIALHQEFIGFCLKQNGRLAESGIFPTELRPDISREDQDQPRFSLTAKE